MTFVYPRSHRRGPVRIRIVELAPEATDQRVSSPIPHPLIYSALLALKTVSDLSVCMMG